MGEDKKQGDVVTDNVLNIYYEGKARLTTLKFQVVPLFIQVAVGLNQGTTFVNKGPDAMGSGLFEYSIHENS